MCGVEPVDAGRCAKCVPKFRALSSGAGIVDAALGELVLARDAVGIDAWQYINAVPGPLGYLRGIDASGQLVERDA